MTYSPKQIEGTISKAGSDLRFLIESTFSIIDKDSKKVPMLFTPAQNDYWPKITPRGIIVKSRKLGFSSVRLARMIAKCATQEYRKCIIVSHEAESTKRILGRAAEMIKNCAFGLGALPKNETIRFPNTNSTIWIGTAGSKAFGRGDDITDYHLTEFAWWEKPDLITGIEEACTNDSEGCIESTAKGYGTPFHALWMKAINKEVGLTLPDGAPRTYAPHFYGWFWDPHCFVDCPRPLEDLDAYERMLKKEFGIQDGQILWRRLKLKSMFDPTLFPQEYPAIWEEAFLVAGAMAFDPIALSNHEKTAWPRVWQGEIVDKGDRVGLDPSDRGRLDLYKMPEAAGQYIISADVAAGTTDGDYSVADVIDIRSGAQVAQWRGHIAPDLFGDVLCLLGAYYNYALVEPEVNNHGLSVCYRIRDNQYPNLARRDDNAGGTDLGWYTSPGKSGTKIELVNNAREAVREYKIKINSPWTISECRTFIKQENGDLDAQKGSHKDCVITLGMAATRLKRVMYIPETRREMFSERVGRPRVKGRITAPEYRRGYR